MIQKNADTPFWLYISTVNERNKITSEKITKAIESLCVKQNLTLVPNYNKGYFMSIRPLLFETEDIVISNIATQIEKIITAVTHPNH